MRDQALECTDASANTAASFHTSSLPCTRADLLAEGEECISASLPVLEAAGDLSDGGAAHPCSSLQPDQWALMQAMYNSLGTLWSRRGDLPAALKWLEKAERLFKLSSAPAESTKKGSLQAAAKQMSPGFTTTLFYLAQVHGHAGDKDLSAQYCGATLQRQLEAGAQIKLVR